MLEDAFVGSSNLMQRQKCLWVLVTAEREFYDNSVFWGKEEGARSHGHSLLKLGLLCPHMIHFRL